jgi:RNA polymerase sigma-70 factor (ECF subfamily)
LTQECFALAFQRLHQLRQPTHFAAWIGTIARHLRAEEPEHAPLREHDSELADPRTAPDDHAEAQRMLAAIRALPEAYRETLALRLVEGMSGAEIAQLTGLTPESVRVNLHRGLQKLRAGVTRDAKEGTDARLA